MSADEIDKAGESKTYKDLVQIFGISQTAPFAMQDIIKKEMKRIKIKYEETPQPFQYPQTKTITKQKGIYELGNVGDPKIQRPHQSLPIQTIQKKVEALMSR